MELSLPPGWASSEFGHRLGVSDINSVIVANHNCFILAPVSANGKYS